jgi:hypothetical protein
MTFMKYESLKAFHTVHQVTCHLEDVPLIYSEGLVHSHAYS